MSIEKIKGAADQIVARSASVRGRGEQATRQAMILPLLESLGYDIWNPLEVAPEYEADTAIKKAGQREKVDYALLLEGQPRVFVEVKPYGEGLDGHQGQLARYFNSTPSVSLAVITDGVEYRFYTDTAEPNIQDAAPFFVSRLDAADPQFDIFMRFHKTRFDAAAIRDFATELKYAAAFEIYLRDQLDLRSREPSEDFVRWVLTHTDAWSGRTTAAVVERFRPIVKRSLVRVLRDVVRRSIAALDEGVTREPQDMPSADVAAQDGGEFPANVSADDPQGANGIITTDRELACFRIAQELFDAFPAEARRYFDAARRKTVDAEIAFKDTTGYFGIYLNKPSNWIMRVVIEARNPWVGFPEATDAAVALISTQYERLAASAFSPLRVSISKPDDLIGLSALIKYFMAANMAPREA